ncbi:MAG: 50S ribosomal protein L22 [Planctomycetota bacterium]|nr:50S ribosomal protein L22 [Planctomycetota bacterium]
MESREFKVRLSRVRMSPRKLRLVADMIRDRDCSEALSVLEYTPKRGAHFLSKLLRSAMSNVGNYNDDHNEDHDVERMYISELRVDEGPTFKRWRAAAMGRAVPIRKRTSHVSMVIREREEVEQEVAEAAEE